MTTISRRNSALLDPRAAIRANAALLRYRAPIEQVQEKRQTKGVTPLRVSAPQHDFLTDQDTYILSLLGGIGSGKTFIGMRWARRKMRYEAGTGTIGGILANTYQQLNQATLPELWKAFAEINFEYGRDYVFGEMPPKFWSGFRTKFGKKHNNVLSVRPWGQAICRSLENYDNLRGIELGWIVQDEARNAKREAFDVAIGRLRCPNARRRLYRFVTSPNGYDWLYELMVEEPAKDPEKAAKRRLIHTKTSDNPAADDEYIDNMLSMYDPRFAQQEIEGKFVLITAGQVYHQFNRQIHVREMRPAPDRGFQVCFDFNRTPFSVVICQTVPSKAGYEVVFAVDEVVVNETGTAEVCQEILRRLESYGDTKGDIEIYGDPAGRHRDTRNNRNDYDIIVREFAKYGPRLKRRWKNAAPPVVARVNAMNAALMNAKGEIRLYVSPKCETLRRDLERVVWKPGTTDLDKTTDRRLTHASDALGYYIEAKMPVVRPSSGRVSI